MKIEVYSPTIRRKEMDAVLTAMVEDKIGPGDRTRLLIQIAREYIHFDYAIALRSPAIALHLALKALNPQPGQGIIISALSPGYYSVVIEDMGLRPLYCDVSPSFPCMSRETIEQLIKETGNETTACCIVLHHTLGYIPDTGSISELGLPVIEDISHSYGVLSDEDGTTGGPATSEKSTEPGELFPKERPQGVFTILGLEERDVLTSGGGALLCAMNRRGSAVLRNYGELPPEYRLPDVNAAMAIVQFKEAKRNQEKRREFARVYTQSSLRTHHKRFVPLEDGDYNNYAFSLVLETGFKDVLAYARKKEIVIESAFEQTVQAQAASDTGNRNAVSAQRDYNHCPAAYSLSLRTVLFPLYPRLGVQEVERVSKLIMTLP